MFVRPWYGRCFMSTFGAENLEVAYRFWTLVQIVRIVTIFDKHSEQQEALNLAVQQIVLDANSWLTGALVSCVVDILESFLKNCSKTSLSYVAYK